MRISLQPSAGALVWLAGQPGVDEREFASASNIRITGSIQVQEDRYIRGTNAKVKDRKNLLETLTFTTTRTFPTPQAAELWSMDYNANMPRAGVVQLQSIAEGGSVSTRYMKDAVVMPPGREVIGCSVILSYEIRGGSIKTSPT